MGDKENKKSFDSKTENKTGTDDLKDEALQDVAGGTGPTCGICNKPLYDCKCNTTNAL